MKTNVNEKEFELFTDMMIERIEAISKDWTKPWLSDKDMGFPKNMDGREYTGTNALFLLMHCEKNGYSIPRFCTFAYVQRMNEDKSLPLVHVNRGEKSFPVLFTMFICINKDTGEKINFDEYEKMSKKEKERYNVFPRIKVFRVFNVEQTNMKEARPELWGKLEKEYSKPVMKSGECFTFAPVDRMIEDNSWICPIKPTYGDNAYFSINKNEIVIPEKQQFKDGESYYGTILHEMTHSTGIEKYLNRLKPSKFGSDEYAREELVAELGSALISYRYGMAKTLKEESVAYLKSWLGQMKKSPQFIKTVLSDVTKAVTLVTQSIDKVKEDMESEAVKAA